MTNEREITRDLLTPLAPVVAERLKQLPEAKAPARFYTAKIAFDDKAVSPPEFVSVVTLTQPDGAPFPNAQAGGGEVPDPESLVVMTWRAKPFTFSKSGEFVLHSINGRTYRASDGGVEARIFPYGAFERLRDASGPYLSSIFTVYRGGRMNVLIDGFGPM